jgi:hypothetical protein
MIYTYELANKNHIATCSAMEGYCFSLAIRGTWTLKLEYLIKDGGYKRPIPDVAYEFYDMIYFCVFDYE